MNTGEDQQALRKIIDMTRLIAVALLVLHFYYYCYSAFRYWQWTLEFTDRLLGNIRHTGLFTHFLNSKLFALGFLLISLVGAKGKKDEKLRYRTALSYLLIGLFIYFISGVFFWLKMPMQLIAVFYIGVTCLGFLLVLSGGTLLSRIIQQKLNSKDIFNKENETFPQEERLLENEYSINLPAQYRLKNNIRRSYINIINPFRGLLVSGTPGS